MSLKQQIFELCNKMAQNGWRELILSVINNQLDIRQDSANRLTAESLKQLVAGINRNIRAFKDYRVCGN